MVKALDRSSRLWHISNSGLLRQSKFCIQYNRVQIEYSLTDAMIADNMTKPLVDSPFLHLHKQIMQLIWIGLPVPEEHHDTNYNLLPYRQGTGSIDDYLLGSLAIIDKIKSKGDNLVVKGFVLQISQIIFGDAFIKYFGHVWVWSIARDIWGWVFTFKFDVCQLQLLIEGNSEMHSTLAFDCQCHHPITFLHASQSVVVCLVWREEDSKRAFCVARITCSSGFLWTLCL